MRYINLEELTLPPGWSEEARRALDKVRCAPPDQRADVIAKNSKVWRKLKARLKKLSNGKCWYCEEKTAHGDVDHRRPKNKVDEAPAHGGYWWKAFDLDNFRYSCPLCNRPNKEEVLEEDAFEDEEELDASDEDEENTEYADSEEVCTPDDSSTGGKGCHFPLWDESKRAYNEAPASALLKEEPLLLDPTVATDTFLLDFDDEGIARPTYKQTRDAKKYQRAFESIKIYHLNRASLKTRREVDACNKVKQWYVEAENNLLLEAAAIEANEDSSAARRAYEKSVDELSKLINDRHEFSAAAKAILRRYRDEDHPWVAELLDVCYCLLKGEIPSGLRRIKIDHFSLLNWASEPIKNK